MTVVWRIVHKTSDTFYRSGQGLYAKNGRTIWMSKGAASAAFTHIPKNQQMLYAIRPYRLVPEEDPDLLDGKEYHEWPR